MTHICRTVQLKDPVPVPEPDPVPGCDVCAALAGQRAAAHGIGDMSTVIDCNIEMGRHPHPKREDR
ncbi:hypothetical protein FCH28_10295 [Streptomyces piniterrae]|uniref:Uncharacterized protein n=1 Tax=Streptomyces piniterrae TaxID=2571125 RepID=A0A4U0NMM8_9ACTN|nr:hypothetical protein [Streptomyces piniterrae]TJZ55701.1 hypothetical protein FCH28_10295 [Streptomyces piniterrae]